MVRVDHDIQRRSSDKKKKKKKKCREAKNSVHQGCLRGAFQDKVLKCASISGTNAS